MSSIDEIRDARIKKIELLKDRGMNPYPAESKRDISLKEAVDIFETLETNKEIKWVKLSPINRTNKTRIRPILINLTLLITKQ